MENCNDCLLQNHNNSPFCKPCLAKVACSNCNAKETTFNKIKKSDFNDKPLCSLCFNHECHRCGDFAELDDPTDEEFYLYAGDLYCEFCARHHICNQCGGGCNYPCPKCDDAHDCACHCAIECSKCGEEFDYTFDTDMGSRFSNSKWTMEAREICENCWEEMIHPPEVSATPVAPTPPKKGCRDMTKCFTNGQLIRHTIQGNTWVGTYNLANNGIVYDNKTLTLNQFAKSHYKTVKPDRVSNVNAWRECECKVNGLWISTYMLPE